jgi:Tfp pilus assembly protein PilE
MGKQRGVSLTGLIITLAILAALAIVTAKLLPTYMEYFSVKKMFSAMAQNGDLSGTVAEIRRSYETRNAIEDVKNVQPSDLQISKSGGETVVSAEWSVKVPMVANISVCIDFSATTAKAASAPAQ